jgi:hypothetical protein
VSSTSSSVAAASVRAFNAAREHERRAEWATFHPQQAERHRAVLEALIGHHQDHAEKYRENRHYHDEE